MEPSTDEKGLEEEQLQNQLKEVTLEEYIKLDEQQRNLLPKARRKKLERLLKEHERKEQKAKERAQLLEAERRAKLEESKNIKIKEDPSLPFATPIKIRDTKQYVDKRVTVSVNFFLGCFFFIRRLRYKDGFIT